MSALDPEKTLKFLLELDFFKNVKKPVLIKLLESMELLFIRGGESLIRQEDLDSSLYILYQGRLRASAHSHDPSNEGRSEILGEISPGELVGEITFLVPQARTSTVQAIRDSLVLKISHENFKKFELTYPNEVLKIARTAITRLTQKKKKIKSKIITLCVIPAGDSDHKPFARRLTKELKKRGPTLLVTHELKTKHFHESYPQNQDEDLLNPATISWLTSLEDDYRYIVYESDRQMTPWTKCCLRQADHIYLIAHDDVHPAHNSIEIGLFENPKKSEILANIELIFLHKNRLLTVTGSENWLKTRPVTGHYHIHLDNNADLARLIRFLNGEGFGLVFSGGLARALSYIGVLKALEELRIEIDFISGTSMGAFIGGYYAKGGLEALLELAKKGYPEQIMKDYTVPLVSMLKGKNMCDFLISICGDTQIEDLWIPFFCISSNITLSTMTLHESGPLWLAIRTSTSIPGIYPPIYDLEGNMHVDGAIVDNMPVNKLRQKMRGGKILAVNCNMRGNQKTRLFTHENYISGSELLLEKINPLKTEKKKFNSIVDILGSSLCVHSEVLENASEKEVDYFLSIDASQFAPFDTYRLNELIDLGYETAMEKLPKILGNPNNGEPQ